MTRHLDAQVEERQAKQDLALLKAVHFELQGTVAHNGYELLGFSVRLDEWETLITLRAMGEGERLVAFVGAETLAMAFTKAVREGKRDKLVWRVDKWHRPSD